MPRAVLVQRLQTSTEILLPTQVRRPKLSGEQMCGAGRSVWRLVCVAGLLCAAEAIPPLRRPSPPLTFQGAGTASGQWTIANCIKTAGDDRAHLLRFKHSPSRFRAHL
jgi:hypothetical protein